jgi:hypothetical protein
MEDKFTQTYNDDGVTATPQRCYITGTDPITYETCPDKCICKRGYGGDYCQLHVNYAKFTYDKVDSINYDYDETSKELFFETFLTELSLSMIYFKRDDMFVVEHNTDKLYIEVGFYSGFDFFKRNQENNTSNFTLLSDDSRFSAQATTSTNTTPLPSSLDSLYQQWGQLQGTFDNSPISNQDSNSYLGTVNTPSTIDDPSCDEQGFMGCSFAPPSNSTSNTGLIVGIVVAIGVALIIFITLVCVLLWCKRNNRGFWKSEEEKQRDEMSSYVPRADTTYKGSTAAPELTIGTSAYTGISRTTPQSQDGVELTNTTVQSVNNHTEVKDPTLPENIKAYKDLKGQVFYVDSTTMTTSWKHPTKAGGDDDDGGYGSGW